MRAAVYKRRNRTFLTLLLLTLVITVCLSFTSVVLAGNKKEEQTYKYYTSVQINPGDTLWSIANTYYAGSNMETAEYIKEIKRLNNLSTDNITSGQYITVIYYSSEYK